LRNWVYKEYRFFYNNYGGKPGLSGKIVKKGEIILSFYSHFKNDKTKCSQEIIFFEITFRVSVSEAISGTGDIPVA